MKRVAVVVETALASGRSLLSGISQFARERDDWQVFHPTGYLGATDLGGLVDGEVDGILARIADSATLEALERFAVPVVDVLGNVAHSPFPLVKCDDRGIGRWVAEAFLQSRHRHFGFIGMAGEIWSEEREAGYGAALGHSPHVLRVGIPARDTSGRMATAQAMDITQRVEALASWLGALPLPCAVMIASDQLGPMVVTACQRAGLLIPEQVSLIGVDNDLPFCELCHPRLSSLEPDHFQVGYEAARLMEGLLQNPAPPCMRREIGPLRFHERASSNRHAVGDPALVRALQTIRERACRGLSVEEVARAAGLSRSVLQRRFRAELGQSVLEVIQAIKLRRAQELLRFTRLDMETVAERSGYASQAYFTAAFKRAMGRPPVAYRKASLREEGRGVPTLQDGR